MREAVWVLAAKNPSIGPLPAWAFWPLPILIFRWSLLNLLLLAIFMGWAIYLNAKGRTALWVWRKAQTSLRSHRLLARPAPYRRSLCTDVALDDFNFKAWRNKG